MYAKRILSVFLGFVSFCWGQGKTGQSSWLNNSLGREALSSDYIEPGPGFKTLQITGQTILCDFKRITLSPSGWPEQITVFDKETLLAPVELQLKLGNETVELKPAGFELKKSGANAISGQARMQSSLIDIETKLQVDYDYTMIYTLRLIPKQKLEIQRCNLVFSLNLPDDDDKLITAYSEVPNRRLAGIEAERLRHQLNVKSSEPVILGAWNNFWLGNTRYGFSWNFESVRDWHCPAGRELIFTPADQRLTLNFIETPYTTDTVLEYKLFFILTPIRRMPANWRTWTVGTRYNDLSEQFANQLIYWQFWRPGQNECHNNQWVWNPEEIEKIADFDQSHGKVRMHYLAPGLKTHTILAEKDGKTYVLEDRQLLEAIENNISLPDYSTKITVPEDAIRVSDLAQWKEIFQDQRPTLKCGTAAITPAGSLIDHSIYAINRFVNEYNVPGIYSDGCSPRPNFRIDGDRLASHDDQGQVRPFFDISSMRDFFKRARCLIRARDPENGRMITHNSGPRFLPTVTLFDFVLFGETDFYWYQEPEQRDASLNGDYYYAHIWGDIDQMKTEYYRQWGMPQVLLPELRGRDRKVFPNPTKGTRTMLCYTIQFDLLYWPLWCDANEVHRFNEVRHGFGMADTAFEIVEFTPYWENKLFKAGDANIKVGYYEKIRQVDPDYSAEPVVRYLVLVSNLQFGSASSTMQLPEKLQNVKVIEQPGKKAVAVKDQRVSLQLAPYDFTVLEISGLLE